MSNDLTSDNPYLSRPKTEPFSSDTASALPDQVAGYVADSLAEKHPPGLSEWENLFYNLPGCSAPVHGFSGVACKTLPFEIVEKTISPTICRNSATLLYKSISAGEGHALLCARSSGAARLRTIR